MASTRILLVNDDGIGAPGIAAMENALRSEFSSLGSDLELLVAAPSHEQSAVAHGISLYRDIAVNEVSADHYAIGGTPADCVKVVLNHLWSDRKPDLVVAGINRGQNVGTCVLYSGTVAAAMEAAMCGVPSVAVSLAFLDIFMLADNDENRPALFEQLSMLAREPKDYAYAARFGADVARRALERGLPFGMILNVNVPFLPDEEIRGVHVCAMSDAWFSDAFKQNENGAWRNVGSTMIPGSGEGIHDDHALEQHRSIAITPLQYDMTAYRFLPQLESWFGVSNQ